MKSITESAIVKARALAKSTGRTIKLSDHHRLRLLIRPTGKCSWQHRFDFNGHEQIATLGTHPAMSIAEARREREKNRELIEGGTNPMAEKRAAKAATGNTFAQVAAAYLETRTDLAPRTLSKARWQLREFLNPELGTMPIGKITAPILLAELRKIEKTGKLETAHKSKELAGRIFMFAIAEGDKGVDRNPAADLKLALKARPDVHLAALTNPTDVGKLMRAIESAKGFQPATIAALKLLPHVFVRPGELRGGQWSEIDFKNAQWTIPAARMKGVGNKRREHIVPLSKQALAILKNLRTITGRDEHIFPALGSKGRALSENALNAALASLGYGSRVHTPHGFRSTASTLLHERGFDSGDIELQLAHVDRNAVRGIYNRSKRIESRTAMMQQWSDYLDSLRSAGEVSKSKKRRAQ